MIVKSSRGKFITFEGGEGAGKSTQLLPLKNFLEANECTVIVTREPGGSIGAELIRELIVKGEPSRWDALTEYLLLSAARRDHIETLIKPALAEGKWVLCDRFFDSSLAYQGSGRGLSESILQQIYHLIAPDFEPDMTYLFEIPVKISLARTQQRPTQKHEDRFEQMSLDFHQRVYDKFKEIALKNSQRCYVIDALQPPEKVSEQIRNHLSSVWF